jgi:ubiquitin-protein ligase E3 D
MECGSSSDSEVESLSSRLSSLSCSTVIYAELLLNIRQVSIFISLPTPSSPKTRVELSSDRLSFTITHDGQTSSLPLPAKVAEVPSLELFPTPNKELSYRLPLDHTANQATYISSDNAAPWAANSLSETSAVSCRGCGGILVGARAVKIWKDLPSENWAEMMEFWHCHKPGGHGGPIESSHVGKGYAAGEKITAEPGLGLVDLCYFLLSARDCSGVRVSADFSPCHLLMRCYFHYP